MLSPSAIRPAIPTVMVCACACIAAAALAACGGSSGSSSAAQTAKGSQSTSISASTAGHIPADEFVDVVSGVPASLDPGSFDTPTFTLLPNWASTLVAATPEKIGSDTIAGITDVEPELATSWKTGAHGSITYTLRHGVKSADGNTMTSADVKYSIDRILAVDPNDAAALAPLHPNMKDPVTINGPYSVTINQTGPSALSVSAMTWYGLGVLDSKTMLAHATKKDPWSVKWLATHSASFGPYQVASFTPSQAITLKANPNYWKSVYFKTVVIKAVPDASTRLELLLSGQASHTTGLSWSQFRSAQQQASAKHLVTQAVQTAAIEELFLNEAFAPFKSRLVREAVSDAIDKSALASSVFLNYEKPALQQFASSMKVNFQPVKSEYNPAEAKKLLAKAGYAKGFTVTVAGSPEETSPAVTDELTLLQNDLARVGITVKIEQVASSLSYLTGESKGSYDASIDDINSTPADPGYFLDLNWSANPYGSAVANHYSNEAVDKDLAATTTLPIGAARNAAVEAADKLLAADVPAVPLVEPATQNVADGSIKGYAAYPNPIVYYANLYR